MNDHDALLRAIGEHPEEDTPRLMYADWLDENDQPERADFVRNQVELARVGLNGPDRAPLVRKNLRYLLNFVPHWKAELPRLSGIAWGDFNRGLIEEVQGDSETPVAGGAAAIFAIPGIHVLRLKRLVNATDLARHPELARLRALKMVGGRASPAALRMLLGSVHLGRLTILDLHGNRADSDVAADIADGRFPDLAELWLGSNAVTNRGAAALASSPHLAGLRLLDLRGNPIDNHTTRAALVSRFRSKVKL